LIILGIDPGIAIMGYGIIKSETGKINILDYGAIITSKDDSTPERLQLLETGILQIIEKYKPDEIAIEELFFNTNVKTAITVAQARGAILLTCIKSCNKLYEYTPLQIKQALTGYGRADKNQIQQMVKVLLNLKFIPKPDDAADALAVALCHIHTNKLLSNYLI
jgi:crossover junction endodeoxyribonuclease RuvC